MLFGKLDLKIVHIRPNVVVRKKHDNAGSSNGQSTEGIYENEECSTITKIADHILVVFANKLVAPIAGRSCFSVSTSGTHDAATTHTNITMLHSARQY